MWYVYPVFAVVESAEIWPHNLQRFPGGSVKKGDQFRSENPDSLRPIQEEAFMERSILRPN